METLPTEPSLEISRANTREKGKREYIGVADWRPVILLDILKNKTFVPFGWNKHIPTSKRWENSHIIFFFLTQIEEKNLRIKANEFIPNMDETKIIIQKL